MGGSLVLSKMGIEMVSHRTLFIKRDVMVQTIVFTQEEKK